MREIDTDALAQVAGTLGVGNPVTAVEQVVYDDSNLQQVYDVGPVLPGYGTERGWFGILTTLGFAVTGNQRVEVDPYARLTSTTGGLGPLKSALEADIWLYRVSGWGSTGAETLDRVLGGMETQNKLNSPFPSTRHYQLFYSGQGFLSSLALVTGEDSVPVNGSQVQASPVYIPHGSVLAMLAAMTIAATETTIRLHWLLWAGPRGMRPPLT